MASCLACTAVDDFRASPSAELLALIRSEYGLVVSVPVRDLGGGYNLNLLVDGSFVVRVYGTWVSADRLAAIQAVRSRLQEDGWPIPPLRRTVSGAGFVAFGERVLEVEAYVSSGSPMETWQSLSAGLPWLGRLHDALRSGPCPPAATDPPVANHLAAARVREDTAEAFSAIHAWGLVT